MSSNPGSSSNQSQPQIDSIFDYKDLKQRYTSLFESGSIPTLNELRSQGLGGQLASSDAPLRSIYWQLYFSHLPLQSPSSWPLLLARQRSDYASTRKKKLRAPDGSYPPETGLTERSDSVEGGNLSGDLQHGNLNSLHSSLNRAGSVVKDLRVNNPLSLDEETPWKSHYESKDLRATISTDVERAFPDNPLFRRPEVQRSLSNLILVWCLLNPDIGYRQGLHELAAAIWHVRRRESVKIQPSSTSRPRDEVDKRLETLLDDRYIEHDTFSMFSAVLQNAKSWYEWREKPRASTEPEDLNTPPIVPIVAKCERIHATLKVVDPALGSHLESLEVAPQLYAMRWVRLMFTREFPLEDALQIWDGIFAEDTSLALVDFVCLGMLERIRAKLLSSDSSEALRILMNYPTQRQAGLGSDYPSLLVQQALRLREATSPTTGVDIVMQNRDILGIDLAITPSTSNLSKSDGPVPSRRRETAQTVASGRSHGQRTPLPRLVPSPSQSMGSSTSGTFGSPSSTREPTLTNPGISSTPTAFTAASSYLPEGISDFARGIYERSDSLGINRALVSTMSNVQKTVGAYAATGAGAVSGYNRGGGVGTSNEGPFAPGAEEAVRIRRAALNQNQPQAAIPAPQAAQDRNAELEALKETNRAMGAVIAACVDVFERQWVQSEQSSMEPSPTEKGDFKKWKNETEEETMNSSSIETLMSLCALKHVRDVLMGVAREFDPAILGSPATETPNPTSSQSPKQVADRPPVSPSIDQSQNETKSQSSLPPQVKPVPSKAQESARHRAFARVEDRDSRSIPPTSNPSAYSAFQTSQAPPSTRTLPSPPQPQPRSQPTQLSSSLPKSSTSQNLLDPLNSTSSASTSLQTLRPAQRQLPQSQSFNQFPPSSISSSSFASHAGTTSRREGSSRPPVLRTESRTSKEASSSAAYPPVATAFVPLPRAHSGGTEDVQPQVRPKESPFRQHALAGTGKMGGRSMQPEGYDPLGAS